ncbi:helix-turn-helix transcriptional regulator [Chitinimonas koreensis]|uniref:helix-turn-helix transcriptional regulator n=1 Tax=Chitinimonas koreensis TaxID=356302 RepID=UPI000683FD3E|nr:YafY family protein [Chitinimonas koreensis]QNM95238.1 YafY family transcriptional regulator [Chitinimonas koreensis]
MTRPTTRVLALLELLQNHGLMSGPELARRLEVDPRTLRRYMVALEELGIPITAERGRDGGYRLMQGFKLPPMMFTDDEALALALGLLAARGLGLADAAPATESARAKLERVMPERLRRQVRALDATVTLEQSNAQPPGDNVALAVLSQAAQAQQRVRLHYRAASAAETAREVDPYALAHRDGRWYLVGHCHLRGGLRSFRLDRIGAVQPLPASFLRPTGFDALGHLADSIATLPRAHATRVRLHTDLAGARRAVFSSLGVLEAVDGGVLLHSQTDDLGWMALQLAALPFGFEIEAPAELGEALAAHARGLLAGPAAMGRPAVKGEMVVKGET